MPLPRTLRWSAAALALLALFAMVGCERGGTARYSDCLLYARYAHPVAALAVPETVRLLDHVDDGLWVLGEGQSLHTVDLSDPRAPRELGVVELPDQVAFHANVATDGSHVYVPVRKQQSGLLAAIDLSDPRHPVLESVITLPGMAHAIAVRGSQGWVPTLDAGLCRLDLSDPSAPQLAEVYPEYLEGVSLLVDEDRLYLGRMALGVEILDIRNPDRPQSMGLLPRPLDLHALALSGHTLYVSDAFQPLIAIDVRDAANPRVTFASESDFTYFPLLRIVGERLYLFDWDTIQRYDITAASEPRLTGSWCTESSPQALGIAEGYLLTAAPPGLAVLDPGTPPPPVPSFEPGRLIFGLAVADGRLCVMGGDGLDYYSLDDPDAPRHEGSVTAPDWITDLVSDGSLLFTVGPGRMDVLDIGHPTPVRVGTYYANYEISAVARSGRLLALPLSPGNQLEVRLVDVTDPATPKERSRIALVSDWGTPAVAMEGDVLVVACGRWFNVCDVSDPAQPLLRESLEPGGRIDAIALRDGLFYALIHDRLQIYEVTPDFGLQLLGEALLPQFDWLDRRHLALGESVCYCALDAAVLVVDISDPFRPYCRGGFPHERHSTEIAVGESRLYVQAGPELLALPLDCGDAVGDAPSGLFAP